ncbi:hypothetical protein [Streptomyces sp. NPDC020965]|uniref:hypothetical protein n=1 Tax=Streptomyces sp. NPDC020965 TaxID=3365105 RepID=UPI0037AD97AF
MAFSHGGQHTTGQGQGQGQGPVPGQGTGQGKGPTPGWAQGPGTGTGFGTGPGPGPGSGTGAIRKFPTGANYAEALQHPEVCFQDTALKLGTVQQSPVLGPKAISGNFASVFSVTATDGRRYAVKCFTRDTSALTSRYTAISATLGALDPDRLSQRWSVGFDFLDEGVLVAGVWYPVLKMAWVQGTDLINWIVRHRQDSAAVLALAERFHELVTDLDRYGIAHGDLQHGNILVADDGTLRLVDYDGMYVAALHGETATENGHRNYQSPFRTAADFGPAMDRFSAWIIYLSLLAVATDSALWDQLHEDHGEYLIVSEADFKDPSSSLAWPLLLTHHDTRLRTVAARVHSLLAEPCASIPELTTDTDPAAGRGQSKGRGKGQGPVPPSAAPGAPGAGVPPWMAGRIPPAHPAAASPGGAFSGRRPTDLASAVLALLGTVLPGTLTLVSALPAAYAPTQAIALAAGATAVTAGRRLRPEHRAARQRVRELSHQADLLKDSRKALLHIELELRRLDDTSARDDTATANALQALQTELRDEQSRVTLDTNRRTARLRQELRELPATERQELAQALEPAVTAYVQEKLRGTPIRTVRSLPTMGTKTVLALLNAGIRTAADFTGVTYENSSNSYGSRAAYLSLPSGRRVRVHGVGEARAATLHDWRASLEQQARSTAPTELPADVERQIRASVIARGTRLQADVRRTESEAKRSKDQLQQRITAARQRMTSEQQQRRVETQRQRSVLLQSQKQLEGINTQREQLHDQLSTTRTEMRESLGNRSYMRFLLTGR